MIRRTPAALAIACAAVLTGCATFTQDDVVASYNGTELDRAELDARYTEVAGEPVDGKLDGDTARTVITGWIVEQVLDETGIVDGYEAGPEESGILCVSLVRPADLTTAQDYVARLEGGESWTDFLAAEFPEVPDGGDVNCIPTETLGPLAPQVAGMSLDNPYAVFLFDDQSVAVLRMRAADEVDPLELAGITQAVAPELTDGIAAVVEAADITVDPQFGQFDASLGGVVPLG